MAFAHSSVIVTGAAVDTRTRDVLSFTVPARPQPSSFYCRFVEMGTILVNDKRLWAIENAASADPRLIVYVVGGTYRAHITNSFGGAAECVMATGPSVGDRVEFLLTLSVSGVTVTMQTSQSINGGAITTSTTGSITIAQAWATTALSLNSNGTSGVGWNAFRNFEIAQGVRTMQQMRVLAGTD